ncbi:hypothetical protein CD33_05515 [Ureibacillus sinduriensis BLB-1 = JCM 15800]|uniref:Intracellular proteinase inhibitor BsuPI domain-containing protein n=1 Tax=Ureibacillus sinduriensis BLB-1 = JCM 15800 TaxID=1384057 RepID=A0A0A3HZB8_9BACL|nr:hypothetical protein CD33_05515 [Ureibacillus sinduriensis BLB-1 = JCM 15800]
MKKPLITILVIILLSVGTFFGYEYVTEPKIVDGVMSKNIDEKGEPIDVTTTFAPGDTIYFSAKQNRFWTDKAQVVWYKGEIATENRFLVEEEVIVNKANYFTANLSVPEGLEEGHYGVTIYVKGSEIMETNAEFDVKK